MSRSNWLLATAAAGCLALGLSSASGILDKPEEQRYQPYRYSADKPAEAPALSASDGAFAKTLEYRTPCKEPNGKDESELCAEWRSAKAGEESAFWAKWGVWVTAAGALLLIWQIILTRRAVDDASKATKAMTDAKEIETNVQRAWVTIRMEPKLVTHAGEDGIYFNVDFIANNIGKTIATNFWFVSEIFFKGQHGDNERISIKIE